MESQPATDRLTEQQAAEVLGCKASSLATWRSTKRHRIPYVKIGRLIYYRRRDLDRWIDAQVVDALPEEA